MEATATTPPCRASGAFEEGRASLSPRGRRDNRRVTDIDLSEFSAEVITVTPEMAGKWLQSANFDNRNLRASRVAQYGGDMTRGEWRLTGEPLIFADTGRVLNGQHRLTACVQAKVPFLTLVVKGVPEDYLEHIDSGLPRNIGDVLKFRGHGKWSNEVGQVAKLLICLRRGIHMGNRTSIREVGNEAIVKVAERNMDEILEALRFSNNLYVKVGVPRRLWAAFMFETWQIDRDVAGKMFYSIQTGVDLPVGSPILALRNWAIIQGRATKDRRARLSDHMHFVAFHKAWNLHRHGKTIQNLRHYDRYIQPLDGMDWDQVDLGDGWVPPDPQTLEEYIEAHKDDLE